MVRVTTQKNIGGFTIMEVVVVVGIFALVLTAFMNIFDWSNSNYFYQEAQVRASSSARQAMTEIQNVTLQGYRVLASHQVGGTMYTSSSTVLVLQIPSPDSNGDVLANTWDYVAIYLAGATLTRKLEAGSGSYRISGEKLLSDNVQSVVFTYDNVDFTEVSEVDTDLTTAVTARNLVVTQRLHQNTHLRN